MKNNYTMGIKTIIFSFSLLLMLSAKADECDTRIQLSNLKKISNLAGGFNGNLNNDDRFGDQIVNMGDLNGDGNVDFAVSAYTDDNVKIDYGTIYIIFTNDDGDIDTYTEINGTEGGFVDDISLHGNSPALFGHSMENVGDMNNDGITDLGVSIFNDYDGLYKYGAVYILFLNIDGTVKDQVRYDKPGDGSTINGSNFGAQMTTLYGKGDTVLVVSAPSNSIGNSGGSVYLLRYGYTYNLQHSARITEGLNGFDGDLDQGDNFGNSVANIGDINNDGIDDLAVGATHDDDGGTNRGAVWILLMNNDYTVKSYQKISDTEGDLNSSLDDNDFFGNSITGIGDINSAWSPLSNTLL